MSGQEHTIAPLSLGCVCISERSTIWPQGHGKSTERSSSHYSRWREAFKDSRTLQSLRLLNDDDDDEEEVGDDEDDREVSRCY